jgi:hypothetical protein
VEWVLRHVTEAQIDEPKAVPCATYRGPEDRLLPPDTLEGGRKLVPEQVDPGTGARR